MIGTVEQGQQRAGKPSVAFLVATSLGLGYGPKVPGTFGSLMGVLLAWVAMSARHTAVGWSAPFAIVDLVLIVVISSAGVWAASRVARYLGSTDPQIVVVDEVAGQLVTFLGLAVPGAIALNWKYFLAGFILFRVFDIWKPFPARQAESLPEGWGIMADDWIAGAYAALLLGLARHFGF